MAWYWWVAIIIAVAAIGTLKMSLFKRIMANKKKKDQASSEEED